MNLIVKPRRKPSQPRAWMTSNAIQDAFLQLVVERSYDKVSMRNIADLAGVGLGTLYQYFPGKDSIAAVTVRSRLRKLAADTQAASATGGPRTLAETVHVLVWAYVHPLLAEAAPWRALLELERRITPPEVYRELYRAFVQVFHDACATATDWPAELDLERAAATAMVIVDGLIKHALLVQDVCPDADGVLQDMECAVNGYFQCALERSRAAPALA